MSVAAFVDVDGVLTAEPINMQYARLLGVEEPLLHIEEDFATGRISNDAFNRQFLPLFRKAGFTRQFAHDHLDDLRMKIGYDRLLTALPDVYFVSSGPNYFLEPLGARFGVPPERIVCSRYDFGADGLIANCTSPSSSMTKADFVRRNRAAHELAVGVGDNPEQDSAFLSHCDVRILMNEFRMGYLSVRDVEALASLLDTLGMSPVRWRGQIEGSFASCEAGARRLLQKSPYDRNVFIITPFRDDARYREVTGTVKEVLAEHDFAGWLLRPAYGK